MNKKGLIGKIFAIIGIIFLVLILIGAFTGWQVYSLYKSLNEETQKIAYYMTQLQKGDCMQIVNIENSFGLIELKAFSACKNPIISIAVGKMPQIPIKCANITMLKAQMEKNLEPIKAICANMTVVKSNSAA